jgi:hypothetical protein
MATGTKQATKQRGKRGDLTVSNGHPILEGSKPSKGSPLAPQPTKQLTAKERRTPAGKFAVHLQRLLDDRGLSGPVFARMIGVDPPAVRRWLRADGIPGTIEIAIRMGKALNMPGHPFPDWREVLPPNL